MVKKGLIILDIDNTLIDTKIIYKKNLNQQHKGYISLTTKEKCKLLTNKELTPMVSILVYKRPYLAQFLKYIFENYTVALWTAAKKEWMDTILDKVLYKYKNKFLFKWHREHSETEAKYMKPLRKVFDKYKRYDSTNTLIIDDNLTTTRIKLSHLHIDRFNADRNYKENDEDLKKITKILKKNKIFIPNKIIAQYSHDL